MKKTKPFLIAFSAIMATLGLCACVGFDCQGSQKPSEKPSTHVSSLVGFDIPARGNYYYGECIDVLDPIVLDDVGNVMDISATVKNSKGEAVEVEYGKFFAEDKGGYTVEYKILTLDGQEHVKTMQINVVEAVKESEVKLVELGDATTYDLLTLLPADQKATVEKFGSTGEVTYSLTPANSTEALPLTSTTLDFSVTEKAYYEFKVELPMGDTAERAAIYSCGVDFYREKDGMIWQSPAGLSINDLVCKDVESRTKMEKSVVSGSELPEGATADEYYLVSIPASLEYDVYAFSILGIHSKAYYESFYEKSKQSGLLYTMQFDFYHYTTTPVKNEVGEEYNFTHFTINGGETQPSMREWHTVSVGLDELLANWDAYADVMRYDSRSNMIWSNSVSHYHHDLIGYWGNFRAIRAAESTATESAILVDMKDRTQFDYTEALDAETKLRLENYALEGEIVWTLNGERVTDFSKIDGAYELQATLLLEGEEIPVYTAEVDFYDSSDGLVWIDGLTMEQLALKQSVMTGEIVTENIPEGGTASEYYHVSAPKTTAQTSGYTLSVKAKHSKAYYEWWLKRAKDSGAKVSLKFDFYHTSQALTDAGYSATYFHVGGKTVARYEVGQWHTIELSLEELVKNFDAYADMTNVSGYSEEGLAVNMLYSTEAQFYGYDTDGYFGNFRIEIDGKIYEEDTSKSEQSDPFDGDNVPSWTEEE